MCVEAATQSYSIFKGMENVKNQGNFYTLETDLLLKANLPQSVCLPKECVLCLFSVWGKNYLLIFIYICIYAGAALNF